MHSFDAFIHAFSSKFQSNQISRKKKRKESRMLEKGLKVVYLFEERTQGHIFIIVRKNSRLYLCCWKVTLYLEKRLKVDLHGRKNSRKDHNSIPRKYLWSSRPNTRSMQFEIYDPLISIQGQFKRKNVWPSRLDTRSISKEKIYNPLVSVRGRFKMKVCDPLVLV